MRDRRAWLAHALMLSLCAATVAGAQSAFPHTEDASTPPKGMLRFKAATLWTRYDARFASSGTRTLGAQFTADSLGSAQFPTLSPIETRVASASGGAFSFSLGHSRVDAVAREEVVPITLEYGVTSRLAVGVMMPIVRRRVMTQFRLDTVGGFVANAGPNPHRLGGSAFNNNGALQVQFSGAISQLQTRLTNCQANPGAAGCPALLGRQAEAQALIASATTYAADVAAIYGSPSNQGSAFVPLVTSPAQAAIAARVPAFNAQFQDLLGTTTNLLTQTPQGAAGPAGTSDIQRFLNEDLGRDSIAIAERALVGDVEVGARYAAVDMKRAELRLRVALLGSVRLATGSRQSTGELADLSTGGGMIVASGRGVLDARKGRVGLLASAAFASNVRSVDTVNLANRAERWTEIDLAPRWHLSEPFSIHGAYSLRTTDKEGGDQLVGGGVSISRINDFTGGPLPIEMRFTHLQAITGDPGRPQFFRDQLELRIYYRLLKP